MLSVLRLLYLGPLGTWVLWGWWCGRRDGGREEGRRMEERTSLGGAQESQSDSDVNLVGALVRRPRKAWTPNCMSRHLFIFTGARCCTMQRADDKLCVHYVVFQCIRNIWVFNGLLSSPPLMFVPLSSIIVYHKDITTLPNRNILG